MKNASSDSQPHVEFDPDRPASGLRILLAEDNALNQRLTVRQMAGLGYRADVVANGQAAVEAVVGSLTDSASSPSIYDLIFMDCQMPVMDGFTATQAIRNWERCHKRQLTRPIIIIALTASDLMQDRKRAIEVGMDDYLTKPVRQEMLKTLLERWSYILTNRVSSQPDSSLSSLSPFGFSVSLHNQSHHRSVEALTTSHEAALNDWSPRLHRLYKLADGSLEFAAELLQLFLHDSYQHLHLLQQAIESQNFLQIEQLAHHVKGASANMGATTIQQIAEEIEQRSRRRYEEGFSNLLTCLEAAIKQVERWYQLDTKKKQALIRTTQGS